MKDIMNLTTQVHCSVNIDAKGNLVSCNIEKRPFSREKIMQRKGEFWGDLFSEIKIYFLKPRVK